MPTKRPDMRPYFRSRIDWHVNGLMSSRHVARPASVLHVDGDVTDATITVTMRDGTVWTWSGGGHASRKINGCYAPLMPKPVKP